MAGLEYRFDSAAPPLPPGIGRVSSLYGWREVYRAGRKVPDFHTAIDIAAPEGTPVLAVIGGRAMVFPAGEMESYGNAVVIEHVAGRPPNGLYSLYAHLQSITVSDGAEVQAGELLGAVGRTAGTRADPGRMFAKGAAHLHFEFVLGWPPTGRDLDRLDPGPVLAYLGVLAQLGKPLAIVAGSLAAETAEKIAVFNARPPPAMVPGPAPREPGIPQLEPARERISQLEPTRKTAGIPLLVLFFLASVRKKGR